MWLGFSFLGVTAGSFNWTHYLLQAVPAASIFAASIRTPTLRPNASWLPALVLIAIVPVAHHLFLGAILDNQHTDAKWYYETYVDRVQGDLNDDEYAWKLNWRTDVVDDAVQAIRRDGRGTTLFSWSEFPWTYVQADVSNPTRYFTSFYGTKMPNAHQEILDDLAKRPPAFILFMSDDYSPFPGLEAFVAEHYEPIDSGGNWQLYGRR